MSVISVRGLKTPVDGHREDAGMKVIDQGTVFSSRRGTDWQSCTFPGICVLPGGRWLCTFRAARTKIGPIECTLLTWSDNEGKTWAEPVRPWKMPHAGKRMGMDHCGYCTALGDRHVMAVLCWVDRSDPDLPFFNEESEGILDCRILLSESEDDGWTWSPPRFCDTLSFDRPAPLTGPVLRLANGDLACQFELDKPYSLSGQWPHAAMLMFSSDGGQTWTERVETASDPECKIVYWDQRAAVLSDGRMLDVFWTCHRESGQYLNIHARESTDHGRTWSKMWDTGVPGQPAAVVSVPDGRVAMGYVNRTGPPAVELRMSSDGGRTWSQEPKTVLYQATKGSQTRSKNQIQDAWAEMNKYSVGLPATAITPGGDLLMVYYAGQETDFTDIHWACVRA